MEGTGEIDWESEAKREVLGKRTVAELKLGCQKYGIAPGNKKKDALVEALMQKILAP